MAAYGQNQGGARLHLSGVGGIYAQEGNAGRVIKALEPAEGIWDEAELRQEIDGFLLRVRTQQRVAGRSGAWMAVHESGVLCRDGAGGKYRAEGAYAVLERCERSVQSLIDGKVYVSNDDLRHIVSQALRGLIDLRGMFGRAHGNLKASNILLSKSADLAHATVQLSDLAADGALPQPAAAAKKDWVDLGMIIYELVNMRPYQGGTIGPAKEWHRLGPNGEDWRKLCVRLLDPAVREGDLEGMLATVATWTKQPKKSKAPLMIAASVALVLGLGGLIAWWVTRPPILQYDPKNWEHLCFAYDSWFGEFAKHFDDNTKRTFKSPQQSDYPAYIVDLLNNAGSELPLYQPQKLARKDLPPDQLAIAPTEDARTGYAPYYTKQGAKLIEDINDYLTPVPPDQGKPVTPATTNAATGPAVVAKQRDPNSVWPLYKTFDDAAAQYGKLGWVRYKNDVESIKDGAIPPALPDSKSDAPANIADRAKLLQKSDVFAGIDRAVAAAQEIRKLEQDWKEVQDHETLPAEANQLPLIKALPDYIVKLPRANVQPDFKATPEAALADIQQLEGDFNSVKATLDAIKTDLTPPGRQIIYAELAKDPSVQIPAGGLTLNSFAPLKGLIPQYYKLQSDPRDGADWGQQLAEIKAKYIDVIQEWNPQDPHRNDLAERRDQLQNQIKDWVVIPALEKNKAEIDLRVESARKSIAALNADGPAWIKPYQKMRADVIAAQTGQLESSPVAKANPLVREQWRTAQRKLLTQFEGETQGMESTPLPRSVFKKYDDNFNKLEAVYLDFDGKIKAGDPAMPRYTQLAAMAAEGTAVAGWEKAIAVRVSGVYRDQALSDIMTDGSLHWSDGMPQVQDEAYLTFERRRIGTFETACGEALDLMQTHVEIAGRLDKLQLNPGDATPSWRELYRQTGQSPLLSDAEIAGDLKALTDRVEALLALDGVSDYKALLAASQSPAAEVAVTGWRKMGTAAVDETIPVLVDEEKAEAALKATLSQGQYGVIAAEVQAQRPERWRRWADTLASPAQVQAALDQRQAFSVTSISPEMTYNSLLYDLRKEFEKNLKEAEVKPLADDFWKKANAMPEALKDPATSALLGDIDKSLHVKEEDVSAEGAGPKLAGWDEAKPSPDVRVFTSKDHKFILQFVKLQLTMPNGATKTTYLCTTEMPFGLFADTLNGSKRFAEIDDANLPAPGQHWFRVSDDPWKGPRIWKIKGGLLVLNSDKEDHLIWLRPPPQMGDNPLYPADSIPAPPSAQLPMQYVTPWSAMFVSRLLGCRLPTADEWKLAYQRYERDPAAAAGLPKDSWNLRGAAWLKQFNYASKMANNSMEYPDNGIFLAGHDFDDPPIKAEAAKPWIGTNLAKLAPDRITAAEEPYRGSVLFFRDVTSGPGLMHDLVGNVAEYVFSAVPDSYGVIKDARPAVGDIDKTIAAGSKNLAVIGGSSLSPPEIPFDQPLPLNPNFAQTRTGFSDVGFRLAYTAPVESIIDVLAGAFAEPHYLAGPSAKR